VDRNRLRHRLDDEPYGLRGNGRAARRTASGSSLGHGRQGRLLASDPGAKSTSVIGELRAESRHRLASRPRRELAVIEVPSDLGLHPSGVEDAPDAFREAALHRLLKPTEVIRSMSRRIARRATPKRTCAQLRKPELAGFSVHLDVDVLDDTLIPAVDHHHPGRLTWKEAVIVLRSILQIPRVAGLDVTIFNPRLDPNRALAARLAALLAVGVASMPPAFRNVL
jgi:arginase family enzyme